MPTVSQILNEQRRLDFDRPVEPYIVAIVSATAAVITTDYGTIPNAIGVTPTTGWAIVINVDGQGYAVGWIRP